MHPPQLPAAKIAAALVDATASEREMSLAEEARRRLKIWAAMTGNRILAGVAPASDSDSEEEPPRLAAPATTSSVARTPPPSSPGASRPRPHASLAWSTPRSRPAGSIRAVAASTPTPVRPKITWSRGVDESMPVVPTASTPSRVATVRTTPAKSAASRSSRDTARSPDTAQPSEAEPADASSDAVVGRARREVKPSPVQETQARRARALFFPLSFPPQLRRL